MQPKGLAQDALDAIALHCGADILFGNDKTDSSGLGMIAGCQQQQSLSGGLGFGVIENPLELSWGEQPLLFSKTGLGKPLLGVTEAGHPPGQGGKPRHSCVFY